MAMQRVWRLAPIVLVAVTAAAQMKNAQAGSGASFGGRPSGNTGSMSAQRPNPGFGSGGHSFAPLVQSQKSYIPGPSRFGHYGCNPCALTGYSATYSRPWGYATYPVYVPYVPSYYQYASEVVTQPVMQTTESPYTYAHGDPAPDAAPSDAASYGDERARYGDHYLDRREAEPRVSVTTAPQQEAPATPAAAPAADVPATVLIFKDGRRVEVHNYAIIGTMLYDLTDHLTKKISLADLDMAATVKLNDERGTPIKLPQR